MNHVVGIDLEKRNKSRQKQMDTFFKEIIDAYIAGGGSKKDAIEYISQTYGMIYSKEDK